MPRHRPEGWMGSPWCHPVCQGTGQKDGWEAPGATPYAKAQARRMDGKPRPTVINSFISDRIQIIGMNVQFCESL